MPAGSDESRRKISLENLQRRMREIHGDDGCPEPQILARRTVGGVSPSTVSKMLHGSTLPGWDHWIQVIEALGGDVSEFEALWAAAQREAGGFEVEQGPNGSGAEHAANLPDNTSDLVALGRYLSRRAVDQRDQRDQILEELRQAATQRDQVSDVIRRLSQDRDTDSQRRRELEERIAALEADKRKLNQQIKKLKGKLYAATAERERNATQLADLNEKLGELHFERAQYEERLRQQSERRLHKAEEKLDTLKSVWHQQLTLANDDNATLRRELADFQRAHRELDQRLKFTQRDLCLAKAKLERDNAVWWRNLGQRRRITDTP
jgi:hypothetical protein